MEPAVSVVISRFGVREATWDRVRNCLAALTRQDCALPFEVLLCSMPELPGRTPAGLDELLPGLRIVATRSPDPHVRKLHAVRMASAPVVAFLDADCLPPADWIARMTETFHYYPEVAVVTGPVDGERGTLWAKVRALVTGGEGHEPGPARWTAENNVALRREAYLEYPLPEASGTRAVRIQTAAMLRARYVLWRDPGLRVMRDRRGVASPAAVVMERPVAG
jgi:hypothetical protein